LGRSATEINPISKILIILLYLNNIIVIYWDYIVTIIFVQYNFDKYNSNRGRRWRSWLRHCATSRKFAGSIPDGVTGNFYLLNLSGSTVVLESTQIVTDTSKRVISWGIKAAGA